MDAILFNPPRYASGKYHKFNNALLWLASYLRRQGLEVRVVMLNDAHFEETVRAEIERHRPRLAAVSCKWWDTLYAATHIASLVKAVDSSVMTVAGGQTASFFARELVEETDFDVVIRGDGEEPLYRLATGRQSVNCVLPGDRASIPVHKGYVQSEVTLGDIRLVEDIAEHVSDPGELDNYVWTGKGCAETCVYCSANAWNNVVSFGRARQVYRPIDLVVRDIEILNGQRTVDGVTFDFDPVRGVVEQDYYLRLFGGLEPAKLSCYFFSWSLPSPEIVDALAATFRFVVLVIDVQTASEALRRRLGEARYLKPFFADADLQRTLSHVDRYENISVEISTLMGLPFETAVDVRAFTSFADRLYDTFPKLRYPYVSPMNVEPGSLLMRSPEKYDMVLFRSSFADFMAYTRRCFEEGINSFQPETWGPGVLHPLGVCSRSDAEAGVPERAYEQWIEIKDHVDRRSNERALERLRQYRKFGFRSPALKDGLDRPSVGRLPDSR